MTMKIKTYRVTDAVYKQLITDDSGKLKYKPVGRARKKERGTRKKKGGGRKRSLDWDDDDNSIVRAGMEEAAAAVSTRAARGSRGRRG